MTNEEKARELYPSGNSYPKGRVDVHKKEREAFLKGCEYAEAKCTSDDVNTESALNMGRTLDMGAEPIADDIDSMLKKLWSIRNDDEFYFFTYGKDWIETLVKQKKVNPELTEDQIEDLRSLVRGRTCK